MDDLDELAKEIKQNCDDGEMVIPFIGSGFSRNIDKSYPDWGMFIQELSKDLCVHLDYQIDCDKTNECRADDRNRICNYLEDTFSDKLRAAEYYIRVVGEKIGGDTKDDEFTNGAMSWTTTETPC